MATSTAPRARFQSAAQRAQRPHKLFRPKWTPTAKLLHNFPNFTFPAWVQSGQNWQQHYFYQGDTITVTLKTAGATTYEIRDFWGTVVSTGPISGTSAVAAIPSGGWKLGWYRVYLYGPNTDYTYGRAYGASMFMIIRHTANFPPGDLTIPPTDALLGGSFGGEDQDPRMNGIVGLMTHRQTIRNISAPTVGSGPNDDYIAGNLTEMQVINNWWNKDPARTPQTFVSWSGQEMSEYLPINNTSGVLYLAVGPRTLSLDPHNLYITTGLGTTSGSKMIVAYPNQSTVVETIDNIPLLSSDAATYITAISAYVGIGPLQGISGPCATSGPNSIPTVKQDGVKAVVAANIGVVERFEGPKNEPSLSTFYAAAYAGAMENFQTWVHDTNPNAKTIGPCPVSINPVFSQPFFDAGGGAFCDEISFHDYNAFGLGDGDVNIGRYWIETFRAMLTTYGLQDKPMWQTEAGGCIVSRYGIFHARAGRIPLQHLLTWEQYGLPRERNYIWYDTSHGFWSFPGFMETFEGGVQPQLALHRVLAEETYGQKHDHALDFGSVQANRLYVGSIYTSVADSSATAVFMGASYMPNATVVFTVNGSVSSLAVIDGFGNSSTVPVSGGLATVTPASSDIPTYVRLPAGVTVSVSQVNGHGTSPPPSVSPTATPSIGGLTSNAFPTQTFAINDMLPMTDVINVLNVAYSSNTLVDNRPGQPALSSDVLADTCQLVWGSNVISDRLILFAGGSYGRYSTPLVFSVQTSTDSGVTWTTRASVDKTASATSFRFVTSSQDQGCNRETYWDEQSIFDVSLGGSFTFNAIRISVSKISYGGEPDNACAYNGYGQSWNPILQVQEIIVPSSSVVTNSISVPVNSVLPKVHGNPQVGYQLATDQGIHLLDWTNGPTGYSYQWQTSANGTSGWTNAASQTRSDLVLDVTYQGLYARVQVTASNAGGAGTTVNSAAVGPVAPSGGAAPANTAAPALSGTPEVGFTLTTNTGTWTGSPAFTYQWQESADGSTSWSSLTGKTTSSYTAVSGDATKFLRCQVTGTNGTGTVTANSNVLGPVASAGTAPTNVTAPAITGTPVVGQTLTCSTGTWTGAPTSYSYQWQLSADGTSWADIGGATAATFVLVTIDDAQFIRCGVVATNAFGSS